MEAAQRSDEQSLVSCPAGWERPEGAPAYLDYNATTPISPEVSAAMQPFLQGFGWGNPSSTHIFGEQAKQAVALARRHVADLIGCGEDEVFFTSGGTESNNWAIKGAVEAALRLLAPEKRKGPSFRLVTSAIEHPAVMEVMQHLRDSRGFDLRVMPVDGEGLVDANAVIRAALGEEVNSNEGMTSADAREMLRTEANDTSEPVSLRRSKEASKSPQIANDGVEKGTGQKKKAQNGVSTNGSCKDSEQTVFHERKTLIVSIMHSNNEVGSLQPVAEIGARLRAAGVLFHTDASQSVGKVPIEWDELNVDLLTVAGHKLYAPKGVGALIVRRGTQLSKLMHGAGHERGCRAGTENIMLIAGLGKACEVSQRDMARNIGQLRDHRDRLLSGIQQNVASGVQGSMRLALKVNGPIETHERLPNTLSISMSGIDGPQLLQDLAAKVACSAGSACHSGGHGSPVLKAMGVPPEFAACTLRLSVGRETTEEEIDMAAEAIAEAIRKQHKPVHVPSVAVPGSFTSLFRQLSYSLGSPTKAGVTT